MMLKILTLSLAAISVGGCALFGVLPPKSEKTSKNDSKLLLAFHDGERFVLPDAPETSLQGLFDGSIGQKCKVGSAEVGSKSLAAAALAGALAELGFNLWVEERRRQINEIVNASRASYAVSTVVAPDLLKTAKCLLVIRYHVDKEPKADMEAVLKVIDTKEEVGTGDARAFRIQPVHLKMLNTVAWTRAIGEDQASVSFAISIKAVARERSELARLLPVSEGATSVPGVKLGEKIRCVSDTCERSALIVYPTNRGLLSFTLGVAEQGVTGFDDKAELAKLDAIKAALGPAIGEAVKARLDP
jgi:hypothetical protein